MPTTAREAANTAQQQLERLNSRRVTDLTSFRSSVYDNAMVASATPMSVRPTMKQRVSEQRIRRDAWQSEAWDWFDKIGEFRYSVEWVGNLLSKARLLPFHQGKLTTDERVVELVEGLFGGAMGQSHMLRLAGINFSVAGEGYIVGETRAMGDHWTFAASTQLQRLDGHGWKVGDEELGAQTFVLSLWRPHPERSDEADAPPRASLETLAEIHRLTQHIASQVDSRLAGAGILFLSANMGFPGAQPKDDEEGAADTPAVGTFLNTLQDAMTASLQDRGSAAAHVPIVVTGQPDDIAAAKHMTFWSQLDEKALELRADAIRRLSLAMDLPPEVLTGTGDLNHWGAWQVEEAAIKAHTEPLLDTIVNSLTTGYLRPMLEAAGMSPEEAREYSIGVDTAAMRLRPNRSAESIELYDRGLVGKMTALRENGFDDSDLMDDQDLQRLILIGMAKGSTTPELVAAAAAILGVEMPDVQEAPTAAPVEAVEGRPAPSLEAHPRREPPEMPTGNEALTASAELLVFRAMERAGNRMKTRYNVRLPGTDAADYYQAVAAKPADFDHLLADAWGMASRISVSCDPEGLASACDAYARELLSGQHPYSRERLVEHLDGLA